MLLKALAVCLLVTQCTGTFQSASSAVSGPIDDLIRAILEGFRDSLSEPQPINDIAIDFDVPGAISLHVNVTDDLLHDLSTFVIDKLSVNVITMKLDLALSLSTLSLECNYAFSGASAIADLFPLYGSGPASFGVEGVVLTANADLKHNFTGGHDHYQIEALDFFFHFDTLDVQIHNMFNNEDMATVIDEFADDLGPVLVDVLVNETRNDLMPVIIDTLNDLLWNATILQPHTSANDEVPKDEPLELMPVKLPIKDDTLFNSQVPSQPEMVKTNQMRQAALPKLNAKKRQGSHP